MLSSLKREQTYRKPLQESSDISYVFDHEIDPSETYARYKFFKEVEGIKLKGRSFTNTNAKSIANGISRLLRASGWQGLWKNVVDSALCCSTGPAALNGLVVSMLDGPSALGRENQVDFGFDAMQNEILVLQDSSQKVYCVRNEDMVYPEYAITLRPKFETPLTDLHITNFGRYNQTVYNLCSKKSVSVGQATSAAGNVSLQKPLARHTHEHSRRTRNLGR